MQNLSRPEYEKWVASTRDARMQWWREAKFGMFIHYGLYSVLGRHEWAQVKENIPPEEYARLADGLCYRSGAAEEWVKLAKAAGMKYAVLTTRHHEGFSLWDSKVNPFNSVKLGPHIDIVGEFVEACRKHGLRIGLYSSLMDWHNPDAFVCMKDPAARRRFLDYTFELNRELLSNYGKIDILWYDMARPMESAEGWESVSRNQFLRSLQPDIIINSRSRLEEDFGNPEEVIKPLDRDWEACMTFNGISWGYVNSAYAVAYSYNAPKILQMLQKCVRNGGNLLLNIGPQADGSVPEEVVSPLTSVGNWLQTNGEAVFGIPRTLHPTGGNGLCKVTANGRIHYLWTFLWPGTKELGVGGYLTAPQRITLPETGEEIEFEAQEHRILLKNLPEKCPDPHAGVALFRMEFDEAPKAIPMSRYPQCHGGETFL